MENLQNNISKIYSLGVILSAISCLARADFNMPLFVFAYFMWKKEEEKTRVIVLLTATLFMDFIWLLYWVPFWVSDLLGDWEKSVHYAVIFCSSLNVVLKIVIIIAHCMAHKESLKKDFPIMDGFHKFEEAKN